MNTGSARSAPDVEMSLTSIKYQMLLLQSIIHYLLIPGPFVNYPEFSATLLYKKKQTTFVLPRFVV